MNPSQKEAKLDLPAEYLPFGFGCRIEDGFVAVHGQDSGRHRRSLTLLRTLNLVTQPSRKARTSATRAPSGEDAAGGPDAAGV